MQSEWIEALRVIAEPGFESSLPLPAALQRLDAVAADKQLSLDPHFRHYLQKRSYQKALAFALAANTAEPSR